MKSGRLRALGGAVAAPAGVEVSCASGKDRVINCSIVPDSFRSDLGRVAPVQRLPWGAARRPGHPIVFSTSVGLPARAAASSCARSTPRG
eukprot:7284013-Pyramimonas_sp.AAC.1